MTNWKSKPTCSSMRFPCSMWEIGNRHTSLSQSSGEIKNGPAKMKGFLLIMISWFDYDDWIAVFPQHSWFHLLQDLSSNLNLVTTELVWLPCLPKRKPEPPGATWGWKFGSLWHHFFWKSRKVIIVDVWHCLSSHPNQSWCPKHKLIVAIQQKRVKHKSYWTSQW